MVDLSAYKDLYIKSGTDCLNAISQALNTLSKNSSDQTAQEEAHRNAHSFKSESMTMGFPKTSELSKMIEFLMQNVLDRKVSLSPEILNDLTQASLELKNSLEKIKNENTEQNLDNTIWVLKKYIVEEKK